MEPIIIDLSQPMSKEKISQIVAQAYEGGYKDGYNAGKRNTFLYGGPYIVPTPAISYKDVTCENQG